MNEGYVPVLERDARIIRGAVAFLSCAVDAAPSERASRLEVQTDYQRRELYSYGRHFPLARYVPRNANGRRRRPLWIINGDAAPRSGLVFCKRDGGLVLVTRMPWSEELAQAAAEGLDVPASEQALHAYQDADYELIRSRFAAADIPVTRADG